MSCVEVFVVFSVRTFDFSVVPRCVRLDEFVTYATLFEARLEQCGRRMLRVAESLGKFQSVVCLNALYLKRKSFNQVFKKYGGAVSAVFLKCFKITES